MSYFNKDSEGYQGRCHGCGDNVPIRELIKIRKGLYDTEFYWLCECCHIAYWHGGFTEKQIYKDLDEHFKNKDLKKLQESSDPARYSGKKIELEDIADFVYDLYFKPDKEIWKCLEK